MRHLILTTLFAFSVISVPAVAQPQIGPTPAQPAPPDDRTHQAQGVVKKIDVKNGTVRLSHEPIASIGWPAKTGQDFVVADREQLQQLRVGQPVKFELKPLGNEYVISKIYGIGAGAGPGG